ncbi:MAG: hypothetical protein HY653_01015 [Acidobacteria bacterium]|nr:hypothetical protein [Acidobacteriota bacterium]
MTKPRKLALALAALLGVALLLRADTTGIIRPVGDGGTEQWQNNAGTSCASATCYTEVNEASGANCSTLPGDSTINHSTTTNGQVQTYDLDESSIPDNSTVTSAIVRVCAQRGGTQNANGNLKFVINGSTTACASNFTSTSTFTDFNCTIDFADDTKTAADDYEVGVANTQARDLHITTIAAEITYTPPAGGAKRRSQTITVRLPLTVPSVRPRRTSLGLESRGTVRLPPHSSPARIGQGGP